MLVFVAAALAASLPAASAAEGSFYKRPPIFQFRPEEDKAGQQIRETMISAIAAPTLVIQGLPTKLRVFP